MFTRRSTARARECSSSLLSYSWAQSWQTTNHRRVYCRGFFSENDCVKVCENAGLIAIILFSFECDLIIT